MAGGLLTALSLFGATSALTGLRADRVNEAVVAQEDAWGAVRLEGFDAEEYTLTGEFQPVGMILNGLAFPVEITLGITVEGERASLRVPVEPEEPEEPGEPDQPDKPEKPDKEGDEASDKAGAAEEAGAPVPGGEPEDVTEEATADEVEPDGRPGGDRPANVDGQEKSSPPVETVLLQDRPWRLVFCVVEARDLEEVAGSTACRAGRGRSGEVVFGGMGAAPPRTRWTRPLPLAPGQSLYLLARYEAAPPFAEPDFHGRASFRIEATGEEGFTASLSDTDATPRRHYYTR